MSDCDFDDLKFEYLRAIFEEEARKLLNEWNEDNLQDAQKKANDITPKLVEFLKTYDKQQLHKYVVIVEVFKETLDENGPSFSQKDYFQMYEKKDFHDTFNISTGKAGTDGRIIFSFHLWSVTI